MSYVHDIGGRHGMGPLPGLDDELDFHAAWETRTFGIVRSLIYRGAFTLDEFRHAIERMDPARYLGASYFERWLDAVERLCVEKGLITSAERDEIVAAAGEDA
ncbi:MAG: nitrile hydratase subunit beta [Pseudonocardiaceae bacterium]|nr:nitrile hydratase subunit beta [Pseudonocardiaceae bacterium]